MTTTSAHPSTGTEVDRRSPGRPRDTSIDDAILQSARRHLVARGYSRLAMGEVAADAGVSRPTLYRRWQTKYDLVSDALDYGLRLQEAAYAEAGDPLDLPAKEAFLEAVRRVDPCWYNPDALVLQANFMGETEREPGLLAILADRAVNPRVGHLEEVIDTLRSTGDVRDDVDASTVATMCFGGFFGAHLRGQRDHAAQAEQMGHATWQLIATDPA